MVSCVHCKGGIHVSCNVSSPCALLLPSSLEHEHICSCTIFSLPVFMKSCPMSSALHQRSAFTRLPHFSFFLFFTFCLSLTLLLTPHSRRVTAITFVGRANYTTCHVGSAAGSRAHGRFSGFNHISVAGH